MKPFSLYCKTYRRDLLRVRRLLDSVEMYNADQLPVFISTPVDDRAALIDVVGEQGYTWVSDEDIIATNPPAHREPRELEGYISQGIIKSEFWRLAYTENYLCIDSDSKFLRDFHLADFVAPNGTPYTVMHQNKELWQTASNRGYAKVIHQQAEEQQQVQARFQRTGPAYSFMPSPFIWSARVWQSLDEHLLQPQQQTLWDLIDRGTGEYHWYGEALLAYKAIDLLPIEPLFRVYHYDWQYYALRRQGESEATVAENYLGIVYQSNWEFDLDYGPATKRPLSRAIRRSKQYLRYLRSFF